MNPSWMNPKRLFTWVLFALALLAAAVVVPPAAFLAYRWDTEPTEPLPPPQPGYGDFSRLSSSSPPPWHVVTIPGDPLRAERQVCDLVRLAAENHRPIAVAGAMHSMGGQTLSPDGIVLDMTGCRTLRLNPEKTLLTAGAGARWSEIIPFLDRAGRSVAIMQSNDDFTVGGSLSVNCHGWQFDAPPIASSVESFRLVDASGSVVRCSRDEHPRLFRLALGGYGLFGVILDATLRVVPNEEYRARTLRTTAGRYAADYGRFTGEGSEPAMAYGRICVAPDGFLRDAMIVRFDRVPGTAGEANTLGGKPSAFQRAVFRASVGSAYGKNLLWRLETWLGGENGRTARSRNRILDDPSEWFADWDPLSTEILQEYFVPPDRLAEFLARARTILLEQKPDLLNLTVRFVRKDDDTALAYARRDVFGLVMLFHQGRGLDDEVGMQRLARALTDASAACGGSYYLCYRPHASHEEMERAYPQAEAFFAEKSRLDPQDVFSNQFYLNYGSPGGS